MRMALRSLWREPAASGSSPQLRYDWIVVGMLLVALVIELALREDLPWPAFAFALSTISMGALAWRRSAPLVVTVVSFGAQTLTDVASLFGANSSAVMYTTVFVLLLPFALARWASGRHIIFGLTFVLACHVARELVLDTPIIEASLQTLFWLFPAALGGAVRLLTLIRAREVEQIKANERQELARELHDTIAHHVSAIAIQAELGLAIAETDAPSGSVIPSLEAIVSEAATSLAEMRVTVAALRSGSDDDRPGKENDDRREVELRPQHGLADLQTLTTAWPDGPSIDLQLAGNLNDLPPSMEAAIYRLAQESVTNAVRHARNATKISITVTGDEAAVSVSVSDNGETQASGRNPRGFGIVGMTERTKLLGGTLKINADAGKGWTVFAELPRNNHDR